MAKEDALAQLHTEKQLRVSAEDRCTDLTRRITELDTQLRALQTAGNVRLIVCNITIYFFQSFI